MSKDTFANGLDICLEQFFDKRQDQIYLDLANSHTGMSEQINRFKQALPAEMLPCFLLLANADTDEEIFYTRAFYIQGFKDALELLDRFHRDKSGSQIG